MIVDGADEPAEGAPGVPAVADHAAGRVTTKVDPSPGADRSALAYLTDEFPEQRAPAG